MSEKEARSNSRPLVSIVIEWDNARASELAAARRMYQALVEQIANLTEGRVVEVFFLYDALAIDPRVINRVVAGATAQANVATHIVGTPGLGYYELKNEGVKRAAGEIVVFLDSDVVPEADWLDHLLRSFRDPAVQVVGGDAYIQPSSVYSRAFALAWFFPLRTDGGPLEAASCFFANNMAGRRDVLRRYPFPSQPRFRGQCFTLAKKLTADGIAIFRNPSARVAHPPPHGVSHFVRRALCEGHDSVVGERLEGKTVGLRRALRLSYWRFRSRVAHARENIRTNGHLVGLSGPAAQYAMGIMLTYYALLILGELLTQVDARIVRRLFPI